MERDRGRGRGYFALEDESLLVVEVVTALVTYGYEGLINRDTCGDGHSLCLWWVREREGYWEGLGGTFVKGIRRGRCIRLGRS